MNASAQTRAPLAFTGDFLPSAIPGLPADLCGAQVISNLECVMTSSAATGDKAHRLILPRQTLEHVVAGQFAALNVANNHVFDAGAGAFRDMLGLLDDHCDAQVYGTRPHPFAELSVGEQRCAVIGCLERCRSRGKALFREEDVERLIREISSDYSQIYVTPHWGKEGEFAFHPSPGQLKQARRWIDAGAAGIFGHHPHVVHGRQFIHGKPVYYSLGNLWFPHEESANYPATRLGMVVIVDPQERKSSVDERFLCLAENKPNVIIDRHEQLQHWLNQISSDLSDGRWSPTRWARVVGPTYITKSDRSWRQRLTRHRSIKTWCLHGIWNLLPRTLLMRFGKLLPRETTRIATHELMQILNGTGSETEREKEPQCSP